MNTIISRKKTTLWNLIFMYIQVIVSIVNGIVIVPLYLHYLKGDLYGAWLATGNILVWLTVIDPGISDIAKQRIAAVYGQKDNTTIKFIISSTIFLHFIIGVIILIIILIIADQLPLILKLNSNIDINHLVNAFKIAGIGTALMLFGFSFNNLNLGLQGSFAIGLMWTIVNIAGTVLNIFWLINGSRLFSIAYASVFKGFLYVIGNAIYLYWRIEKEKFGYGFNWNFLKSFSKIFSYTFISKIAETIANNVDLILVARFVDSNTVTMLELCRRPIKVFQGFLNRPSAAMVPALSNLFGENNIVKYKKIFIKFFIISTALNFLILFGFVTFNKSLNFLWLKKEMYIGNTANLFICITFFITTTSYNLSNFVFSIGKIREMSIVTTIRSILLMIFLFTFGYLFKLIGVLLAPLLAYLLTENWIYLKILNSILKLNKNDIVFLLREFMSLLIIGVILTLIFINLSVSYWLDLIVYSTIFTFLYLITYYGLSSFFRIQMNKILINIKIKFFNLLFQNL